MSGTPGGPGMGSGLDMGGTPGGPPNEMPIPPRMAPPPRKSVGPDNMLGGGTPGGPSDNNIFSAGTPGGPVPQNEMPSYTDPYAGYN